MSNAPHPPRRQAQRPCEAALEIVVGAVIRTNDSAALAVTSPVFEDMVKYVVDIERRVAAVGGELEIEDSGHRDRVRDLTFELIGCGEPLE